MLEAIKTRIILYTVSDGCLKVYHWKKEKNWNCVDNLLAAGCKMRVFRESFLSLYVCTHVTPILRLILWIFSANILRDFSTYKDKSYHKRKKVKSILLTVSIFIIHDSFGYTLPLSLSLPFSLASLMTCKLWDIQYNFICMSNSAGKMEALSKFRSKTGLNRFLNNRGD